MHTIRKFIDYYAPYKTVFFIDLICAAFISIVDLAYPQILRTLTNTLFTEDSSVILSALPLIAIGLLVMYIVQSLCKYYVSYQGHMMGANMERDMRQQLFDHYEKLSFSYYSQNNSGQMMSKLVSDLFDIAEFAHHGPENLFISVVKIVGSFIFLFLINWRLALPLTALVLCMFLFSIRQNKRMQETFMENRRKIGDVNASLQDTLAGIRVVQSFANEGIEREKFRKSNHAFLLSKRDNYNCMGSFMGWNLFFQGMMYLVTLVFGGYQNTASKLVQQMLRDRVKTPLIGPDGVKDETFLKMTGKDSEGVMASYPKDTSTLAMYKHAREAHVKQFGSEPGFGYYNAYAATQALIKAIEVAGSTETDKIMAALKSTEVDTPLGKMSFNKAGDATGLGLSVYVVKDGKFVESDHSITLH